MRFTINPFYSRLDAYELSASPTGNIDFLTGDSGGAVAPDGSQNVNIIGGTGATVAGFPLTNTLQINVSGNGMTWTREAGAAVPCVINHGYINTNAGLTTFTLPLASAVGDIIAIAGESAAGWTIAQNAGQNIQISNVSSSVGVGGSVSSTNRYDSICLVCRVANTTWHAYIAPVGVLKII